VLRTTRHELSRWLTRPGVPLLLLLPAVLGAMPVARRAGEAAADAHRVEAGTVSSATAVTAFEGVGIALGAGLPLLALLLAGLVSQSIAGELARGTLRNLVLRPVRRWQLVAGKALAGLAVGALAYALLALAALAAAAWAFDFADVVEILPNGQVFPMLAADELWPELRAVLRAPLVPLTAFVGLGFLAGVLARSGAGALGLALALVLALDLGRGFARAFGVEAWLPGAYLPSPLGDTSFVHTYRDLSTGVSNASFAFAETQLLVPAVWCLVSLALAALVFGRRPIP
jgi:ABC-type transport system involved in multi-copper enzyme maturation permease subunit